MNYEQDYLSQQRAIAKSFRRHVSKLGIKISDDDAVRELIKIGIAGSFHDKYLQFHNIKNLKGSN